MIMWRIQYKPSIEAAHAGYAIVRAATQPEAIATLQSYFHFGNELIVMTITNIDFTNNVILL